MIKHILTIAIIISTMMACSSKQEEPVIANPYANGQNSIIPGSQQDLTANVGDRIFYSFDSYALDSSSQSTLTQQANWLKQYTNVTVTVEGHCDERGTREYNLALGERRAVAVRNYLIGAGVDAGRISVISYGKERPEVLGSNDHSWSQNRRGVLVIN